MSAPVIFSATSTKGGVGKTTLIANVAELLADIGLRVLLIDADVQPSLSKLLSAELPSTKRCCRITTRRKLRK